MEQAIDKSGHTAGDRVFAALASDPRTKEATIEVAHDRGVITLAGRVKSNQVRQAAEEIARQQAGVVTVINELKVG